ncbi:MAG: hypothetical protein QW461_08030 [Candidatus Jordarchaeales archaeon]
MSYRLTVSLPPEGTLIRDLTVLSLVYVKENVDEVEWQSDKVIVKAPSQGAVVDAFEALYENAARVASGKAPRVKIGLLQNDRSVFSKLIGVQCDTYLDAVSSFLLAHKNKLNPDFLSSSLSHVSLGADELELGVGKKFPALNLLVSEKYERGLEFGRLNLKRKFDVRLDEEWYALVLSGLAFSVSSFIDNDLLLTCIPEHALLVSHLRALRVLEKAYVSLRDLHGKVSETIYSENVTLDPVPAFLLLLALSLAKKASDLRALHSLDRISFVFYKFRRSRNVFTLLGKHLVELLDLVLFAARLVEMSRELVSELVQVARRTIELTFRAPREDEPDYTVYNRFCTLLVQAIQGAYSIHEIVYYGARYGLISGELAEGILHASSQRGVLPAEGKGLL